MNQNENNFEDLKRLLKLKQHEVPPPGYFNDFSGQVVSRIRAGEAGGSRSLIEQLESSAPWVVNFLRIFETRPGVIGGFATSLCLLLVLVVVFAERSEKTSNNLLTISEPAAVTESSVASMTAPTLAAASDSSGIVASTNPVTSLQPVATLFGQPGSGSLFQPAGFAPAGH
ncbi:MAG TPA: hypothetical protein VF492_10450 [Verrucomicrobiae bacterium]